MTTPCFNYIVEIAHPWGVIDTILTWCHKECQYDWRWQMLSASSDQHPGQYRFYFENSQDCCAFSLKWA